MNVEDWRELVTVIECKSLTAAAEKMGYTLSGMSRRMAALEVELGFQLLHRGKKGIQPTKECQRMMPYIHELIYTSDRLSQAAASIKGAEEGEIRIGTAYRHYYRWLTDVTSVFHDAHPGVHFKIYNGISSDFAMQLKNHQLEIALISQREGNHEWQLLCHDPLVVMLPEGHALTHKKKIPLNAFLEEAYIETCPGMDTDSSRFFKRHTFWPNVQFSAMDLQATYAMVEAGMGISITNQINSLPNYQGICHRELEPTEIIEIGIAYLSDLPPAAKAFWEFIQDKLPCEENSISSSM